MKTAVKELMEKIESYGFILHDDTKKEFLEKEKQQIIEAYNDAVTIERGIKSPPTNGIKYFKKKYEQ